MAQHVRGVVRAVVVMCVRIAQPLRERGRMAAGLEQPVAVLNIGGVANPI